METLLRCPSIDDSRTDYSHLITEDRETLMKSGPPTCPVKNATPGNLLFIIGGREETEVDSDKIYVLSLDSSVKVPSCFEDVSDFPVALNNPTTATFPNPAGFGPGLPTVCGGGFWRTNFESSQWPDTIPSYWACYQFNPAADNASWVKIGSKNPRYAPGVLTSCGV